jgi:hypothetical protein
MKSKNFKDKTRYKSWEITSGPGKQGVWQNCRQTETTTCAIEINERTPVVIAADTVDLMQECVPYQGLS